MIKRLTKTGNSLALVLDRRLLEQAKIDAATPLEVTMDGEAILVSPVRAHRARRQRAGKVAEARGRYASNAMPSVGLRELKTRLGEYVRRARSGSGVLVTDRGHVVAELLPPGSATARAGDGLVALARRGLLTLGAPNRPEAYRRMPRSRKPGLAKRLLDLERGKR